MNAVWGPDHEGAGYARQIDVAFLAAELVAPTGQVLGVDRSPEAVALARSRAKGRRYHEIAVLRENRTVAHQDAGFNTPAPQGVRLLIAYFYQFDCITTKVTRTFPFSDKSNSL